VWLPLLVGARLVVAGRRAAGDAATIASLVERHEITFLQATPVTWRLLLDAGWSSRRDLQAVSGGEALPMDLASALAPRVVRLWNMYGPTETTVYSTGHCVAAGDERVLIGRPIANTTCYVLDESQRPVPPARSASCTSGARRRPRLRQPPG